MQITIKLMGMLKQRTPVGGKLELADGATVADALRALEIPAESIQAFSVNGAIQRDHGFPLHADDELTVLPPVGGG